MNEIYLMLVVGRRRDFNKVPPKFQEPVRNLARSKIGALISGIELTSELYVERFEGA